MSLHDLKQALSDRELTLYLGAGVSMPSGLPNWDRLVLMMYLAALGELDREPSKSGMPTCLQLARRTKSHVSPRACIHGRAACNVELAANNGSHG